MALLIGDTGLLGTMKGLEASAAALTPNMDEVKGVFVSDRDRCRLGVLGGGAMLFNDGWVVNLKGSWVGKGKPVNEVVVEVRGLDIFNVQNTEGRWLKEAPEQHAPNARDA